MRDRYGEFKRREAKRLVEEWEATAGRGISIREAGRVLEKMASKPAVVRDRYKSKGPKARTMEYNPERDGYGSSEPVLLGSQRERARSYTRGLAGQFIQGVSADFSDEIAGAVSGVLHAGKAAFTDEEMGEAYHRGYDETTKGMRKGFAEFEEAHPIASAGAQLSGAAAFIWATQGLGAPAVAAPTGRVIGELAKRVAPEIGKQGIKRAGQAIGSIKQSLENVKGGKTVLDIGKGSLIGSGMGGLYGAGSGEGGVGNRMDGAGKSAAGGALVGGGAAGLSKVTQPAIDHLVRTVKPLTDRMGLNRAASGTFGGTAAGLGRKAGGWMKEQIEGALVEAGAEKALDGGRKKEQK